MIGRGLSKAHFHEVFCASRTLPLVRNKDNLFALIETKCKVDAAVQKNWTKSVLPEVLTSPKYDTGFEVSA